MRPSAGLLVRLRILAPAVALAYFVLLGGTPIGEQLGALRVINTGLGAALILFYVWRAPARSDRLDRILLGAVLLMCGSALVSAFPRQALDAILAMVAYAAVFYLARDGVAVADTARSMIWTLRLLSVGIVLYAAVQYLPSYIEWLRLTDAGVVPPLGLPFVARPWGHAYDLTTLAVMLIPSWLLGRSGRPQLIVFIVLVIILAVVVFLLGSRAQWLAVGGASALLAVVPLIRYSRQLRRRPMLVVGIGLAIIGLGIFLGGPIIDRLLTSATIGQRVEMWSAGVAAWLERPVTGFGPGTFPWVLQETTYFDTNSVHPRHPDGAIFQLLPEAGLLGLTAAGLVVGGIGVALVRARAYLSLWPICVFALDGLGGNPTDFSYLIIVAAIWAAFGIPRDAEVSVAPERRRPALQWIMNAGMGLIAIPVALTLIAGIRFDAAASDVHSGDLPGARDNLSAATALDPGMALYVRQRGIASMLMGDDAAATRDLAAATRLNPNDDLSWRAFALALRESGEDEGADAALGEAIRLQRSDKSSLMLRAAWDAEDGDAAALRALLPEIALAWPTALAAPGWDEISGGTATADMIAMAIDRWQQGLPSPEPIRGQAFILAVLGERLDLIDQAKGPADLSDPLAEASIATGWCDPDAGDLLMSMPTDERRSSTYWALRVQHAAELNEDNVSAYRLHQLTTFTAPTPSSAGARMNPLRENNARGSIDAWGYDRVVIRWENPPIELPLPDAGADRMLIDPRGARAAMGLTSGPGSCTAP